jgi:hypothetical protein
VINTIAVIRSIVLDFIAIVIYVLVLLTTNSKSKWNSRTEKMMFAFMFFKM